jgi:hypothetical protein
VERKLLFGLESRFYRWLSKGMPFKTKSVKLNHREAIFIQFIKNEGPPYVSSITRSSSRDATQTAFGILRAYYVCWLCKDSQLAAPGLQF